MRRIIRKRDIVALLMAIVIALGAFALLKTALVYSHLSTVVRFAEIEANYGQNKWNSDDTQSYNESLQRKENFITTNPIAGFLASFGSSTPKQLLRLLILGVSAVIMLGCGVLIYIKCMKLRWYFRHTKVQRRRYRQRSLHRRKRRPVNHGLIKS